MDTDAFWALIHDSGEQSAPRTERESRLHARLIALPLADIAEFQSHVINARQRADSWDLWGAAARINGGYCSDDGFEDFRNWLIGRGRAVFERVAATPDALAGLPEIRRLAGRPREAWSEEEHTDWESLSYLAERAYEALSGEQDEDAFDDAVDEFEIADFPDYLAEDQWKWTDEQAAAARLPELTRLFPLA